MRFCLGFENNGCSAMIPTGSRCRACQSLKTRDRDYLRGSPDERGYNAEHRRIRKQLMAESPFCSRCGAGGTMYCDHILALSLGGQTSIENAELLCGPCHHRKTTADQAELERRRKAQ